jgi:hypothetical protein
MASSGANSDTTTDKNEHTLKIIGGVVVVVIAVGVFLVTRNSAASCQIGAYGVEAIAVGVTHGRSADQIATASNFVPTICEGVINSLIEDPEEEVTLNLELPTGGTTEQTIPGTEVLNPAPPAPGSGERIVKCLGWNSSLLFRLCVDGNLPPPS